MQAKALPPVQQLPIVGPITQAADQFYANVVEPPLDMLGIGVRASPLRRFAVVTLATGVAVWVFKPSYLFDENGKPRPFSITGNDVDGIALPWWMFAPLTGTLSVLFI